MKNNLNFSFERNANTSFTSKQNEAKQKEVDFLNIENYIVRANEIFPVAPIVLKQNNTPVFSTGDISLITGEAKAKKTFLVSLLVAAFLSPNNIANFSSKCLGVVLHIDTEQGRRRTHTIIRRIYHLLEWDLNNQNENFITFSLRELCTSTRFSLLEEAIKKYSPKLVFIDGFADLINNTNDLAECSEKVGELMRMAEDHQTHICSVVHTNPNSDKTRGHVGSEMQRKCETVMLVKKEGETSTVFPQFCRNQEFEKFSFFISQDGLPELCDSLSNSYTCSMQLYESIFNKNKSLSYADLRAEITKIENCSQRTAERKIKEATKLSILEKNIEGNYYFKPP